jgi:isocitrate/isopropylmalate dehydrogenase
MEKDYPEVEVSYEFVDAVAMRLVQWPNSMTSNYENLFGDILTDEASVISGSMGLMPSASVGEHILYMNQFTVLIRKRQVKYCKSISDHVSAADV